MAVSLYVETNFLMAAAMGREPDAAPIFSFSAEQLRIALPVICLMEALSAYEDEAHRRRRFSDELDKQINQVDRDQVSTHAQQLRSHLEEAKVENRALLNDIGFRLQDVI